MTMFLCSIWERYFLRELFKVFIAFLLGFYTLFVLIDYSTHTRSFQNYHFAWHEIIGYYGYQFIGKIDALLPFAILIAVIKTLYTLNKNNELMALMSGGIRMHRLLAPFLVFGISLTAFTYFNMEVLQPKALKYNKQLGERRALAKQKKWNGQPIRQLTLEDNSALIFGSYNNLEKALVDVYWIKSIDDIYRIHTLLPYEKVPIGKDVEHMVRDKEDFLQVVEFSKEQTFTTMPLQPDKLLEFVMQPSDLAISALYSKLPKAGAPLNEKEARLLTTYYYKLAMPWACLLAVIAPAPFCIRFSRTQNIFFVYALSLFGLVALCLIMDAATLLGERQVLGPALAIWLPFGIFSTIFAIRYVRS